MLGVVGCGLALVLTPEAVLAAEPAAAEKPPWQRLLQGDDARKAEELQKRVQDLQTEGRLDEALHTAEELARLRQERQGRQHWQAGNARFTVEAIRRALRSTPEDRQEYVKSFQLQGRADMLVQQGRAGEALPLLKQILAIQRKVLGEEHPEIANSYNNLANDLEAQGKYAEAVEFSRKALDICRKVLGEEHPDTAATYHNLAYNLNEQGRYAEAAAIFRKALDIQRKVLAEHPDTAFSYNSLAANFQAQGKYAEAAEGFRKALDIRRKAFGEEHPLTAQSYHNVAVALYAQGKYAEAAEGFRKALSIRRKVLGEEHPETASSYNGSAGSLLGQGKYAEAEEALRKALAIQCRVLGEANQGTANTYNNLAFNLTAQGKYAAAAEVYRKALAIERQVVGEEHPLTATSYNNLSLNLQAQGNYAAAEEGFRKALFIRRKLLGEEHPDTATIYNNVAFNLAEQGRDAAAEEGYRKALNIFRKVLGEEHPHTAQSYHNVASVLYDQGKHAAAQENYEKALAIRRKVLGEKHPDTAQSYNNLGWNLRARGKDREAEESFRKALAIRLEVLGEKHPTTAISYHNVGCNLMDQGKYTEAEAALRKALDINLAVLGADHPHTASAYNNLAKDLRARGRYTEAEGLWLRAADSFTRVRSRLSHSGLERASFTDQFSPLLGLASVLARNGKPAQAWQRYEESLARGTWDDLSARLRRPAADQAKQAALMARLDRLDGLLQKAVTVKEETAEQKQQREDLLGQRRKTEEELDAFVAYLVKTYGAAAGAVFEVPRLQTALGDDTAFVGWIDLEPTGPKSADPNGDHWAFLLRSQGRPVCVPLQGGGGGGAWTEEDTHLPKDLRIVLREHRDGWQRLATRLRQQRLAPLARHLAAHDRLPAVRHLIVLPSAALAGVPVEVFSEDHTVSYAHSGTLFAHLRTQPKVTTAGLFGVADPIFEARSADGKGKPLPPAGVLLTVVPPGSNAAGARLKSGDVLLSYNGKALSSPDDLPPLIAAAAGEKSIAVTVWREESDKPLQREVGPGKLGVVLADKPAPEAIQEQRRLQRRLASRGDDDWRELPGTRAEIAGIARLFGAPPAPLVLTDSQASEQKLYELAQSGELKKYRYLHLATHGEVNDSFPLRSAVILSRDNLPDAGKQLLEGKPVFDGRLTAEEVLRQWNLDCDLVTLSACQTALGKYEGGEGHVGFAQALVLCGSRSVCLSLWKVDDTATALLMQRFYANLLGKREGLKAPLGKAEALAEAKRWLRTLPREPALKHAAAAYHGIERGKGRTKPPLLPALPEATPEAKGECPYAHPYYWAAFVLTGDPE
jgi:tetratricopeptide (TPR) repeat protein